MSELTRWRLDIAYDGTDFSGWARQPERRTVQAELEQWLATVLRMPPPSLVCAGRTDAGVHARGQVAHVDLPTEVLDPYDDLAIARLHRRLGQVLPSDIALKRVIPAPQYFDARFGAIWRLYTYRIWDNHSQRDPLLRREVAAVRGTVDLDHFNDAAVRLLGLRDFAAFCKRRDGATTIRTLLELHADRVEHGRIEVTVRADAFCHSMVRSLVGALTAVGTGKRDPDWLGSVARSLGRATTIQVMPAHGLTLERVGYPPDNQLLGRATESRTLREEPTDA